MYCAEARNFAKIAAIHEKNTGIAENRAPVFCCASILFGGLFLSTLDVALRLLSARLRDRILS